nr:uncharacterized protein LOC109166435 [Ipomoea batatas]
MSYLPLKNGELNAWLVNRIDVQTFLLAKQVNLGEELTSCSSPLWKLRRHMKMMSLVSQLDGNGNSKLVVPLKLLLHEYLKSIGEDFKSGEYLNLETKRMLMKWQDTKNKVDCGVALYRLVVVAQSSNRILKRVFIPPLRDELEGEVVEVNVSTVVVNEDDGNASDFSNFAVTSPLGDETGIFRWVVAEKSLANEGLRLPTRIRKKSGF